MISIEIPRDSILKIEEGTFDRLLKIPMVENYGFIETSKIQPDGDLA